MSIAVKEEADSMICGQKLVPFSVLIGAREDECSPAVSLGAGLPSGRRENKNMKE